MAGDLIERDLTNSIIGAFFDVYGVLGFGLLESMYSKALEQELRARGHSVARQVAASVMYKGVRLGTQRLDLVVDERVVVEVKSTPELHRAGIRQLYCYLKASRIEVGLLLHFGPEPKFRRLICRDSRA